MQMPYWNIDIGALQQTRKQNTLSQSKDHIQKQTPTLNTILTVPNEKPLIAAART